MFGNLILYLAPRHTESGPWPNICWRPQRGSFSSGKKQSNYPQIACLSVLTRNHVAYMQSQGFGQMLV